MTVLSSDEEANWLIEGLKQSPVTISLCPGKERSKVGSSERIWDFFNMNLPCQREIE